MKRGELDRLAVLAAGGDRQATRAAALWDKAWAAAQGSATRRHHLRAATRVGRRALADAAQREAKGAGDGRR